MENSLYSSRISENKSVASSMASYASQQDEIGDFASLQNIFIQNRAIEMLMDYIEYGTLPEEGLKFTESLF